MSLVTNNLTPTRHTIDEANEQIVLFNGLDRPRYYNPVLGAAGYLGISDWFDYSFKPIAGVPTLTVVVDDSGVTDSADAANCIDSGGGWTIDEWIGFRCVNITSGLSDSIASNTATTLVLTTGVVFGLGDSYEIQHDVAAGSLDDAKYYSIYIVPVNGDVSAGGFPVQGNATAPSIPVLTTAPNQKIPFTVPVHPQMRTNLASLATATGTTTLQDTTQTWTVDEWIGFEVFNVETGLTSVISSNTSDTLTFPDDIDTDAIGDRYQITSSEITARFVYASVDASAANAVGGTFFFVGIINDNTTTTFDLTVVTPGEVFLGDNFAPPNAFTCHVNGDVTYVGGGIKVEGAAGNTAEYNGTPESVDATIQSVAVAEQDDDYAGANTSKIMRYTVTAGDEFTALYIGSFVTITDSASAGNDLDAVRVLHVGDAMEWFEVLNNTGVDDAADAVMQISMTPNVIVGTGTTFTEGMVDAQFEFTNDNSGSYRINWVDVVAQVMGISPLYTGNNASTTAEYRVRSDYDLHYSDFKNPHKYRSISLVEIGDEIKGLYALGRSLIVFCSGSVWRHNMLEPGAAPQLISDEIFFDATHSICSNGKMVMFYDGEGISITDGVTLQSVTALKGRDYLNNVNKELAFQIQGIYNPKDRRFEFTMPMGTETNNNYGIHITEDSFNNVPYSPANCRSSITALRPKE